MNGPHENAIRPSVWILAAVVFVGSGYAMYEASQFSLLDDDEAAETEEARAHRVARRSYADRARPRHARSPSSAVSHGGGYQHHDWGQESELNRAMALHLPTPGFWQESPEALLSRGDPQMIAMWRSFNYRRESPEADPTLPFEPTAHRLTLLDSEGEVGANPSSCDVRVLPVTAHVFNCVIRVMCDGEVLYPDDNQNAGYVQCEFGDNGEIVRAVDTGDTAGDGDPLVDLNLEDGTITVEDFDPEGERSYRATLRIQS